MSKNVNNSSSATAQLQDHGLNKEAESEPSSSGYVLVLVLELKFCHSLVGQLYDKRIFETLHRVQGPISSTSYKQLFWQ